VSLVVSSSPHLHSKETVSRLYLYVVIALVPAVLAGVYFFKARALSIIFVTVASALLVDLVCQKLTKRRLRLNGSALITGLLLALVLPPTLPLWLPVIGVIVAIALAKYAFGPGNNIFNPALVGRVFLAVSFPTLMSVYLSVDGVASATPLTIAKVDGYQAVINSVHYGTTENLYLSMFIGNHSGSIGETSVCLLLLGGIFLIVMKVIDGRIPLCYMGTVAVMAFLFKQDILFYLMAGGLILGAFFMATDCVTTPITKKGRIIFSVGCGILTVLLRIYSGYPEGVMFSILLMNAATPLIDRLTKPRPFGK
jgi:electron transport complex protein RnfD